MVTPQPTGCYTEGSVNLCTMVTTQDPFSWLLYTKVALCIMGPNQLASAQHTPQDPTYWLLYSRWTELPLIWAHFIVA